MQKSKSQNGDLKKQSGKTNLLQNNGPQKVSSAYKTESLSMYPFSQEQQDMLFGLDAEYRGLSICADVTLPDDLDTAAFHDKDFPATFFLFSSIAGKPIEESEIYSAVRIPKSFAGRTVRIGICLSKIPSGFALDAAPGVKISNMAMEKKSIGWNFQNGIIKYSFGPAGGTVYSDLSAVDFSDGKNCFHHDCKTEINLLYFADDVQPPFSKTDFSIGNENFLIRHIPNQQKTVVSASALENPFSLSSLDKLDNICGLVMKESAVDDNGIFPITADPGLVVGWHPKRWRNVDYEIFSWEEFPNVLIFDTKDYIVQDKFFKRLAFFAEKQEYRGTLVSNAVIENEHGFNAYDFRPYVIADFFNKAQEENFSLSTYELWLKKILMENGVLLQGENESVNPGNGAVISISQSSPKYLRWMLMSHEGFHGIYFSQTGFFDEVEKIYNSMSPMALEFIRAYYVLAPDLNYDINYGDLVQNELMAYTLQRGLDQISGYYINLAKKSFMEDTAKNLSDYIISTKAKDFVEIARSLDAFINKAYGLNSGRVYLISRRN